MGKLNAMALIGVCHLTWKRHLQEGLLPHGITLKQYYLLRQLARMEYLYPKDIASMLFCDRPTASVIIRNMEASGWVVRKSDPDNKKHVRIFISTEGCRKIEQVAPVDKQRSGSRLDPLACFSAKEVQVLEELLERLRHHLGQVRGAKGKGSRAKAVAADA